MDLNRKYSDHQKEVIRAAAASTKIVRQQHLHEAESIAGQIAEYQGKLGAAAACAWGVAQHRLATCA